MREILIILLSLVFLPSFAQKTYTTTYHNIELRTKLVSNSKGTYDFVYGLEQYGQEILSSKYQFEYNEMLRFFIFYDKKEVRIFSAMTGKEIKKYVAPRRTSVVKAYFKPLSSFTYEIEVNTGKNEKSLGVYTAIKGKVYEIPQESRYIVH